MIHSYFISKNAIMELRKEASGCRLLSSLLYTQEVRGSSPLSPSHRILAEKLTDNPKKGTIFTFEL
jgi:hypothetical protein